MGPRHDGPGHGAKERRAAVDPELRPAARGRHVYGRGTQVQKAFVTHGDGGVHRGEAWRVGGIENVFFRLVAAALIHSLMCIPWKMDFITPRLTLCTRLVYQYMENVSVCVSFSGVSEKGGDDRTS